MIVNDETKKRPNQTETIYSLKLGLNMFNTIQGAIKANGETAPPIVYSPAEGQPTFYTAQPEREYT